ncbi:tRNA uridine-5-carboxymethylaminomethyl(34) synthesis GTPase MnmE [Sphingomonas solaris]|uniref:tRNA modification GTPase MnmE n=1 Tax=Alterirhizorhabdus solaris TaxID=2529389 RepID=A0A558R3E7_9SPHN|nr:tRNA uridine-5-carboxymethylaminomethyl(34) synthesis GTPase MnmE [Sphingomonas solaris]TVV73900.1 tRNA uridine-5-carboxymethylaminomethyl(34) synthesis GTPase MnmE [Sphingomonas solaris]
MTIFALSSGAPPAAIGVIRISGPGAGAALAAIVGRLPAPRRASYAAFSDPADGELLDRGLALWFPGPRTATGEDLAELHIHGGRSVATAVLAALGRIDGLRAALPGEFTRRAFANGAIDLAEAEGLADLLAAETDLQRRAALASAGGALSRQVEAWRRDVLGIAAQVEALLDFADEDDVPADEAPVRAAIDRLSHEIAAMLATPPAERLRDGIRVVLAGAPNVGKSTLLNAIAGREAAIVSPIAGTTRDVIEVPVAIGGIPFLFSDTAGLRDSHDPIERAGVSRAETTLADADIILWLADPAACPHRARAIVVHPRCDIAPAPAAPVDVVVSAVAGEGMAALLDLIVVRAGRLLPRVGDVAVNRRQRDALQQCSSAVCDALRQSDLLLMAEHLREARQALDAVVGRSGVEEMLDALFGRFCIGK